MHQADKIDQRVRTDALIGEAGDDNHGGVATPILTSDESEPEDEDKCHGFVFPSETEARVFMMYCTPG